MAKIYKKILLVLCVVAFGLIGGRARAAIESHESNKKGRIKVGDTVCVKDNKFVNNAYWSTINNISATDVVTLRMLDGVYMNYSFSCHIQVKVSSYTTPSQTTPHDTTITLIVNYVPGQGTTYKGMDSYTFSGAYRVVLTVMNVSSPEVSVANLPASFQLSAAITVNRKYRFDPTAVVGLTRLTGGGVPANRLSLFWSPVDGAEEFDVEWTTVNNGNGYWHTIDNAYHGSAMDDATLNSVFRNNSSRITTSNNTCSLSMLSNDDYMMVRIRQVQYDTSGVRIEGIWNYKQVSTAFNIWQLAWHEENLNWQYSSAFAEEGKMKEVISYFDGSLRGRQTVTINNTDNIALGQENIYDEFGRVTANILPAPYKETSGNAYLHYIQNFNVSTLNTPYNFHNIAGTLGSASCELNPDTLSMVSGAANYYSVGNPFKATDKKYNYLPNAQGFPLSATQYTADNTGRIKVQGGVGLTFQPGKSAQTHTTKYYYGKPDQWELDRLFGNDVGYAEHYLKNMVVDPNGQISLSYVNASGKTIATALTGKAPGMLDTITSYSSHTQTKNVALLNPGQFTYDASALKLSATTTYLASVIDTAAVLKYNMQRLVDTYPGGAFQICSDCYYELKIKVVNDCNDTTVINYPHLVKIGSDTTAYCSNTPFTDSLQVKFRQIGEYYITFEFAFNKGVIENYVDNFIKKGTANGFLHSQFSFVRPYLDSLDFMGCLGDCTVCVQNLGSKAAFTTMFTGKLRQMQVDSLELIPGSPYDTWVKTKYDSLKLKCDSMQRHCDMGPCNAYQSAMEKDVSPGGQYALFDAYYQPVEPAINVITTVNATTGDPNWRTVFPVYPSTDTVHYQQDLITLQNGDVTSPYAATMTADTLAKYWKTDWAVKFLQFHPEYCKLLFCNAMSVYENWDQQVQILITKADSIPTAPQTLGLHYSHSAGGADWLLAADPFFSGSGSSYRASMDSDLVAYTSRVLHITASKGLTQFIDYNMYCADPASNTNTAVVTDNDAWDNCVPQDTCRVLDREWQTYKDAYFALKAKYYNKLRDATTCSGICPVGVTFNTGTGTGTGPAPTISVTDELLERQNHYFNCSTGESAADYPRISHKTTVRLHWSDGSDAFLTTPVTADLKFRIDDNSPSRDTTITFTINPGDSEAIQLFTTIQDFSNGACGVKDVVYQDCVISTAGALMDNGTVLCNGTTVTSTSSGGNYYVRVRDSSYFASPYCTAAGVSYSLWMSKTTATLYDGAGHIITNTGPNDPISIDVNYNLDYFCDGTDLDVETRTINIAQGQSSGSFTYIRDNPYGTSGFACVPGGPCSKTFGCVSNVNGATLLEGTKCDGYSETPGTIPTPPPPPPPSPCGNTYANKQSRFAPDPTQSSTTSPYATDLTTAKQQGLDSLQKYIGITCESNADNWRTVLTPGLLAMHISQDSINTLRDLLIDVCKAGGDSTHLAGASDLIGDPNPGPTTYSSFGAAIKGYLGMSTFTASVNPWLISSPPPYSPKLQQIENILSKADTGICGKLARLQTEYTTSGSTAGLYSYLVTKYGPAMNISASDLQTLQKGCGNCRFWLDKNIVEPVFLDPGAKGCITPLEYGNAITDLRTAFGNSLDTSAADTNYHVILTNFMNQRWGFALNYDQYHNYEVALAGGSSAVLCNQTPFTSVEPDKYSCIKTQIAIAAENGDRDYDVYIDNQKELFRLSYLNTCSLAKGSATLRTQSQDYHYTLYYYDQADNLVRTIPPEGVHFLTASQIQWADEYRDNGPPNCGYNGPLVNSVKDTAFHALSVAIADTTAGRAVEMWLYNNGTGVNQVVEETPDRHYLYLTAINGNRLQVEVYTSVASTGQILYTQSNIVTIDISAILPLQPWTHVVVQGTNFNHGALQVYLNGKLQSQLSGIQSDISSWAVSSSGSTIIYPDNISTLKHLRLYNRLLDTAEIGINARDKCFGIAASAVSAKTGWYRFNVPDTGSITTIAYNSTIESQVNPVYPAHTLPTTYAYNSTNQVVKQKSPDGGINRFWYDLLSRLNISQNDKQLPDSSYSYTNYDVLGRITEVGQKHLNNAGLGLPDYLADTKISGFNTAGSNTQITHTYYDTIPAAGGGIHALAQNNLRKRVVLSTYKEHAGDTVMHATYYNYDIDGNVKTLYQQIAGLGIKQMDYEYDLVSGKVNFVRYQDGKPDQFYYRYNYDADNRLTDAWSGIKAVVDKTLGSELLPEYGKQDAHYDYYLHGPLARLELGDQYGKVQGIDYAYTLQGWLKGINGILLNPDNEMGQDGRSLANNNNVARDAYSLALSYYGISDYANIVGANQFSNGVGIRSGFKQLYNGNISAQQVNIKQFAQNILYIYNYDQLNRLKRANDFISPNSNSITWTRTANYKENFTYDGNGNILSTNRNGNAGLMDSLAYNYSRDADGYLTDNRLHSVNDRASDGAYSTDLKNQSDTGNYKYDAIGNLIHDTQAGIDSINWSVYGKIKKVAKGANAITYSYDPGGQRVTKTAAGLTSYYVRDAQGNTLALYDNAGSAINWREQDLYGSKRLGMWQPNINVATGNAQTPFDTVGRKFFELANHLGNVLATITDKRVQTGSDTTVDHYEADVASAGDYYAFGMQQPGRTYNGANYRYGFNGKENDNEVKGTGDQQDYGMRIYNPRLGRFLSVDLITAKYPELTPYQFASNDPISNIDLDGLEGLKSGQNVNPSMWDALEEGDAFYPLRQAGNGLGNLYRKAVANISGKDSYERHELVLDKTDFGTFSYAKISNVPTAHGWEGVKQTTSDLLDLSNVIGGEKNAGALFNKMPGKSQAIKEAIHHIFTNKNFKRGEKWSEKFVPLFEKAAYKLDDAINKVKVLGHKGPHPDDYHREIFKRLTNAIKGLEGEKYIKAFESTLKDLSKEVSKEGTELNKMITGSK